MSAPEVRVALRLRAGCPRRLCSFCAGNREREREREGGREGEREAEWQRERERYICEDMKTQTCLNT